MSVVNVLIIKNGKISFIREHYRKALKLLENPSPKLFLDSGYIVLDFDFNLFFNAQNAFSINDIKNKKIRQMKVFTV
jgi:hypothetical protein